MNDDNEETPAPRLVREVPGPAGMMIAAGCQICGEPLTEELYRANSPYCAKHQPKKEQR